MQFTLTLHMWKHIFTRFKTETNTDEQPHLNSAITLFSGVFHRLL